MGRVPRVRKGTSCNNQRKAHAKPLCSLSLVDGLEEVGSRHAAAARGAWRTPLVPKDELLGHLRAVRGPGSDPGAICGTPSPISSPSMPGDRGGESVRRIAILRSPTSACLGDLIHGVHAERGLNELLQTCFHLEEGECGEAQGVNGGRNRGGRGGSLD